MTPSLSALRDLSDQDETFTWQLLGVGLLTGVGIILSYYLIQWGWMWWKRR